MNHTSYSTLLVGIAVFSTQPIAAADWELFAAGGFGFYRNASITNSAGWAEAGIDPRFAPGSKAGGWLHDFVPLLGIGWRF